MTRYSVEILMQRPDGAQLALRGPHLLERDEPGGGWRLLRTVEGSHRYRHTAILDAARARGYLADLPDPAPPAAAQPSPVATPHTDAVVRVTVIAEGHKRDHVEVTTAGSMFAARIVTADPPPWSVGETIEAALAAATGLDRDGDPVAAMAARARAKAAS